MLKIVNCLHISLLFITFTLDYKKKRNYEQSKSKQTEAYYLD